MYQSPQHVTETCILVLFSHLHMQMDKGLQTEVTMPVPPSGSYTWKKINSHNPNGHSWKSEQQVMRASK